MSGGEDELVLGNVVVKVHALDTDELETLVYDRSAQLIGCEFESEEEGRTWLGWYRHVAASQIVARGCRVSCDEPAAHSSSMVWKDVTVVERCRELLVVWVDEGDGNARESVLRLA